MRRSLFILGQLWMTPMTAFGLALGALGARYHSRTRDGVVNLVARPKGIISWYMRRMGISAWTLGATITYRNEYLLQDERLYRHEYQHVLQTMMLGPLMPLAYVGSSLWQVLRGRRLYRDNWFEVRARRAEDLPRLPP